MQLFIAAQQMLYTKKPHVSLRRILYRCSTKIACCQQLIHSYDSDMNKAKNQDQEAVQNPHSPALPDPALVQQFLDLWQRNMALWMTTQPTPDMGENDEE